MLVQLQVVGTRHHFRIQLLPMLLSLSHVAFSHTITFSPEHRVQDSSRARVIRLPLKLLGVRDPTFQEEMPVQVVVMEIEAEDKRIRESRMVKLMLSHQQRTPVGDNRLIILSLMVRYSFLILGPRCCLILVPRTLLFLCYLLQSYN